MKKLGLIKFLTFAHSMQLASGVMMVAAISLVSVQTNLVKPPSRTQPKPKVTTSQKAVAKDKTPAPPTAKEPAPKPEVQTQPKATVAPVVTAPKPSKVVAATSTKPGKTVSSLTPTASAPASSGSSSTDSSTGTGGGTGSSDTSSSDSSSSTTTWTPSARYTSTNWSGYMTSGASYATVSGNWVVPSPTGNGSTTSADATWIGIGGVTTQDLIQTGTENTVTASGQVATAVFYELLPSAVVYPGDIIVSAGDSISASITEASAGQWTISVHDLTNSQSFTTAVSYTSTNSSAEWIEEDPSYINGSLVPFDNFGSVVFSGGTTTANGVSESIGLSGPAIVYLVDSRGNIIATPSDLTSDGGGFTITGANN